MVRRCAAVARACARRVAREVERSLVVRAKEARVWRSRGCIGKSRIQSSKFKFRAGVRETRGLCGDGSLSGSDSAVSSRE